MRRLEWPEATAGRLSGPGSLDRVKLKHWLRGEIACSGTDHLWLGYHKPICNPLKEIDVFRPAAILALVAIVLGIVSFGGFAGGAAHTFRILFWAALLAAIVLFIFAFTIYYHVKNSR